MRCHFDTLKSNDNFFICYQSGYDVGDHWNAFGFSNCSDFIRRMKLHFYISEEDIKKFVFESEIINFFIKHKAMFFDLENELKQINKLYKEVLK